MTGTTGQVIDQQGVNHPIHYNNHPSGVECIEVKRYLPSNLGDAFKYVFRRGEKGDTAKDLMKALWYLTDELTHPTRFKLDDLMWLHMREVMYKIIAKETDRDAGSFYYEISTCCLVEDEEARTGALQRAMSYVQALWDKQG